MNKHNKKRNTGLIYEFLVRSISNFIVNKEEDKKKNALGILKKHFNKNSELYKEFRLFNSLVTTTVSNESVAENIIEAAKKICKSQDDKVLDYEKSLMIRDINKTLDDKNFYNRKLYEYKIYATIQTLFNEWKNENPKDIVLVAEYEEQLKEWLLKKKEEVSSIKLNEEATPFVQKIMLNKFNEKYKNNLSDDQATIIKEYVFNNSVNIKNILLEIRNNAIKDIENYLLMNKENNYIKEKLLTAKRLMNEVNLDERIDDSVINKFLDVCRLRMELQDK